MFKIIHAPCKTETTIVRQRSTFNSGSLITSDIDLEPGQTVLYGLR